MSCQQGTCVCPNGGSVCGATCCAAGNRCVEGQCLAACGTNEIACGSGCCPSGQSCCGGQTCCPVTQACCDGGVCCGAGETCVVGVGCCPSERACPNICCAEDAFCYGVNCCSVSNFSTTVCGDVGGEAECRRLAEEQCCGPKTEQYIGGILVGITCALFA